MSRSKILICGAGVSGSILAYWLAQNEFDVVVVERSSADRKLGQGIEIEEPATQVVKRMGVMDELRQRRTGEAGFKLLDERSRCWAQFDIGRFSPTGSLEMMRGDLTEVLYKAANASSSVEYRFQTTIEGIEHSGEKAVVQIQDRTTKRITTEAFDFVVGADGARSRTRDLVFGTPACFNPVGAFVAYFSIPKEEQDWPHSRLCHFSQRRVLWLRPTSKGSKITSVYLIIIGSHPALREAAEDREKQREAMAGVFADLGWETPRVLKHMMHAENFYFDELMQVKLPSWSQGRVALVGDSAWAPTPFTGEGNQLAIIGAWVLAQEMSRDCSPAAFTKYEKRLRSYVEECQKIPLGGQAPKLICPESARGIWIVRLLLMGLSWGLGLLGRLGVMNSSHDVGHPIFDLQMDT